MTEPFGTDEKQTVREEIHVSGSQLVDKVKELLHQGNIRRLVIRHAGTDILELPLTVAAVGAVFMPALAALGALGALIADCSIVVERLESVAAGDTPADGAAQ
ncbi:MAG: DUF4342 domain-containing protein [Anaerolineae bacterium]|jgi:hypothetical protein|nr:DUF4342 domain-containing protein [Chloroflexota bacterium]